MHDLHLYFQFSVHLGTIIFVLHYASSGKSNCLSIFGFNRFLENMDYNFMRLPSGNFPMILCLAEAEMPNGRVIVLIFYKHRKLYFRICLYS